MRVPQALVTKQTMVKLVAAGALVAVLGACGSSSGKSSSGKKNVDVKLTKAGCSPAKLTLPAGPTTFHVTNDGADKVSELEVLDGDRIVGEVENLSPGLSGTFSITLKSGKYTLSCPGGSSDAKGVLTVSGSGSAGSTTTAPSAQTTAAVTNYRAYLTTQVDQLVAATTQFANAVESGNIDAAKAQFAGARSYYESIEPVAESFGDLDPEIDAREGDVPAAQWTGFHRIEKALWVDHTTAGMAPVAQKLVTDVKDLQAKIATIELEPAQIANGSVELMNEVAKSKITGEEDRYSHTDLSDFEANVDGAKAAFTALRPLVAARNAKLASQIDQQFADVDAGLGRYRSGDTFVSYQTLTSQDTRALAATVDVLADQLAKVASIVISPS